MKIAWYPRNLVSGLFLFALFALALNVAVDVNRGALTGLFAVLVFTIIDLLFTVNPAVWQARRRTRVRQ